MKKKTNVAYHEAGHAMAYLLIDKKFKYVTIKATNKSDGHLKGFRMIKVTADFFKGTSVSVPRHFNRFFLCDFINLAGFVAEKMYSGRYNIIGAEHDYKAIADITTEDLPVRFVNRYLNFLSEYTQMVFQIEMNWIGIEAIAAALLERDILDYYEVVTLVNDARKAIINNG